MKRRHLGAWLVAFNALLVGCGGGDEAPPPPGARASISVDANVVSIVTTQTGPAVVYTLTLTLADPPPDGVYVDYPYSSNAIQSVTLVPINASSAELDVAFKPGSSLPVGVYTDTINVAVCRDNACKNHVSGSPFTVTTSYTVAAVGMASAEAPAVKRSSSTGAAHGWARARVRVDGGPGRL